MHTKEIVSYLQKKASAFTPAELLQLLDQVQKIVYSKVTAQTEVIDEATGMPPFLATQDNIFTYDCPANCQRTLAIFAQNLQGYVLTNSDYGPQYYGWGGKRYANLMVKSTDAYYGQVATITFQNNPQTYANRYYHHYNLKPIDILSTNIQMQIPEQFHLDVVDGVLARIRNERYGDQSDWRMWVEKVVPTILHELNKGAQLHLGETRTRPEYQHYVRYPYGERW